MRISRMGHVEGNGIETGPSCVTHVYHSLGIGDVGIDEYIPPPTKAELMEHFDIVERGSNPHAVAVLAERDGRIVVLHMAVFDDSNPGEVSELRRNEESGRWEERSTTVEEFLSPYPDTYPKREVLYLKKKGENVPDNEME